MPRNLSPRWMSHSLWLESFATANLLFLTFDIWLAHSENGFRHWAEHIPLFFSLMGCLTLLIGIIGKEFLGKDQVWRITGFAVGATAIVVGIAGLLWHLESHFFQEFTINSLVYTAPFAAPLAYTGIGLLLVMNRMVSDKSPEWPRWVVLLAWGGFVGNFVFSLADHAQNGFFHWTEWIPVWTSALAVGFLVVPFFLSSGRTFLVLCGGILVMQVIVGLLGFCLHVIANLNGSQKRILENFIYGAPAMAPLLLPNLALLAGIGLWVWAKSFNVPSAQPL